MTTTTTTVLDVASYILAKVGSVSAMKLQKLVYYAQAWSLVWDERPLFDEQIQAWKNGPVVRRLYAAHRGKFMLEPGSLSGDPSKLDATARETVDAVLSYYGDKTAQWLSDLTHSEAPWMLARAGVEDDESSTEVISHASMAEYYGALNAELSQDRET